MYKIDITDVEEILGHMLLAYNFTTADEWRQYGEYMANMANIKSDKRAIIKACQAILGQYVHSPATAAETCQGFHFDNLGCIYIDDDCRMFLQLVSITLQYAYEHLLDLAKEDTDEC